MLAGANIDPPGPLCRIMSGITFVGFGPRLLHDRRAFTGTRQYALIRRTACLEDALAIYRYQRYARPEGNSGLGGRLFHGAALRRYGYSHA